MNSFNWHSEAEKQWDMRADFWNQNSEQMWNKGSRKTILPFIQKHFQKEITVIDIGCGDGFGSYKLAESGYKAIGVDISHEMIERAKKRTHENAQYIQSDLMSLPFPNHHFSGVMAINSLEWTENPFNALKEINRITALGGYLCVGLLGPTAGPRQNAYKRLYNEPVICNTMMPWEFEQLAIENGWELIDCEGVYKEAVKKENLLTLPRELKQALTFMWLFMFKKIK
ncbi:class I SAM-dependent methyltransferase [Bacillus timonensis]|nr:class I SAM-dependent methyltransferase [Bacillus timonensis]